MLLLDFFKRNLAALWYLIKLGSIFFFLYVGTLFVIGCGANSGRFYFPWIHEHFYYLDWLRDVLLRISEGILRLLGYDTKRVSLYVLRIGKSGISLNNGCLAYGLMSFWIAFVVADINRFKRKLKWLAIGLALINVINIIRVCLIVLAGYYGWGSLPNIDHHDMFNIAAYILVFLLIYFYSRDTKRSSPKTLHVI